jgi:hypothetical protein
MTTIFRRLLLARDQLASDSRFREGLLLYLDAIPVYSRFRAYIYFCNVRSLKNKMMDMR